MSSQRTSCDKLLWSNDPSDLVIAPFLVVDGSKRVDEKFVKADLESDCYRSKLPSRIVIIDNDASEQRSNAPFPPVLWVKKEELSLPNHNACQSEQEQFILNLYDKWIENLITRRGLNGNGPRIGVSIYFEDGNKAEAWQNAFEDGGRRPAWASDLRFPRDRPSNIPSELLDVNVWRHIPAGEVREAPGRPPLFYEMTSYHNAFFSFLYSVDPNSFHAQYLLRQIVESALLRVLVIDDRVAGNIWGRQDRDNKIADLRCMGIFIARKITVEGQEDIVLAGPTDPARGWVNLCFGEGGLQSIMIDDGNGSGTDAEFDLLFIHQTIFENKIAPSRREKKSKNEWVFSCKRRIPYIVFHSGRGKQTELLPENAAFLEYSALQEHLLQEPSKFFLTQIALSARG